MKRWTLSLLAVAVCIVAERSASGQIQQSCDCNQSHRQSGDTWQPTQWNNCPTCDNRGGCRQMCQQHCESHGSRLASLWTRPLCPGCCAAQCCATKSYPDAGWNPPAHMPVNYDGAWYGSYLPQNAYGTSGGGFVAGYATVYQPTDTTQMGYYYNKVPTWQTRSGMIPPVPYPADYHARVCPHGGAGCNSHHGVTYAAASSSCQNCNTGHYSAAPHYTSPNGHHVVRAAGPQRQGLLGGFRLTSMMEVFD